MKAGRTYRARVKMMDDSGDWPERADQRGRSLELINPDAPSGYASSWEASRALDGSPGVYPPPAASAQIVINEILTHTDLPWTDRIELYNAGVSVAGFSGWYLSDSTPYNSPVTPLGPWSGRLDNAGETLRLNRPDAPPAANTPCTRRAAD